LGLLATDHEVPSHDSMRVWGWIAVNVAPTATQVVELVQDTPSRLSASLGSGLATIDHDVPSQDSTSVCCATTVSNVSYTPTATQLLALVHDTLFNWSFCSVPVLGLGTIDQLVPSHDSTSVCQVEPPESVRYKPTAVQLVALTQDTPSRSLPKVP
jgi:hypothetical protein